MALAHQCCALAGSACGSCLASTNAPRVRAFCLGRRVCCGHPHGQVCGWIVDARLHRDCGVARSLRLERLAAPKTKSGVFRLYSLGYRVNHNHKGEKNMSNRTVEIFSAGCPACEDTIKLVNSIACPSCEISVLNMKDAAVAERAKQLGITQVPAVVVNGKLADCCAGTGPDEAGLRAAGVGTPA